MAARAFMEQVRTVILQRRVRETQSRSEAAGVFQSLIAHIIERDTEAPPTFAARCHSAPCAWMLTSLCRRGRLAAGHPANARSSRPVRIVAYGHHALSGADSQEA